MRPWALPAAALLLSLPAQEEAPGVRGALEGAVTWSGEVRVDGDVEVPEGSLLRVEAGTKVLVAARDATGSGWNPDFVEIRVAGEIVVAGTADRPVVFQCGSPAAPAPADDASSHPSWSWHGIVLLPPSAPGRKREIRGARIESAFAGVQIPKGRAVVEGCVFLRCGIGVEVGSAYADAQRKGIAGGVARPVIEGCRFAGCETGVFAELEGAPSITRSVFARCRTGAGNNRGRVGYQFPLREPGVAAERCEFHACAEGVLGPSLVTNGIFSGNAEAVSLSRFHSTHATSVDLFALRGNVFAGNGSILSGEAVAGEFVSLDSAGYVDDPVALDTALRAPWPPLPKGLALRADSQARGKALDGGDPGCTGAAAPALESRTWSTVRARLLRPLVAETIAAADRAGDGEGPARMRPQAGSIVGRSWWCRTEFPEDGVLRTRTLLGRGEGEALLSWRVECASAGPAEIEVNGDLLEAGAWWNGDPVAGTFAPRRFDRLGAVAAVKAKPGANLLVLRVKGRGVDPRLGVAVSLPGGAAPAEAPLPDPRPGRISTAAVVRARERAGPWLRVTLPSPAAWGPPGIVRLVAADGSPVETRDGRLRVEERTVLLYGPLPDDALGGCGLLLEGFRAPDGAALDFGAIPFAVPAAPPR